MNARVEKVSIDLGTHVIGMILILRAVEIMIPRHSLQLKNALHVDHAILIPKLMKFKSKMINALT